MKMYSALADWWPLISSPSEYRDEAKLFSRILKREGRSPRTVLELGSGGGNTASHMKSDFSMTLVDIAPKMLAVSQALNPECQHIQGDMKSIRLETRFDAVFIHDAIMYMTDIKALTQALATAKHHCRPEGAILVIPSVYKSNFTPQTYQGGMDNDGSSIRFLEWRHDPDPADSTFDVDFSFLLREEGKPTKAVHDHHTFGLFSHKEWRDAGASAGLTCKQVSLDYENFPKTFVKGLLYNHITH